MHGRLGFIVNDHSIPRAELQDRDGFIVNHKSQTNMHYVLP